jgi:hypothetical protein
MSEPRMQQTNEPVTKRPLRLAIHQPNFLPRLKVLQKLACADVWCVLDSVQYCAREWQNRACIVAVHGNNEPFWLSVPVQRPHGRSTLISEVAIIDPASTVPLIERTLLHAFHRAPHWAAINDLLSALSPLLTSDSLTRLCVDTTRALLRIANRQPTLVLASSLPVKGKASNLMSAICRHLKATTYLADSGSRNYLQEGHFTGIEVVWQNWCEPTEQWPGISLWRNMSSINYLCRVGPEQFAQHLVSGKFGTESTWRNLTYKPFSSGGDYHES